MYDTAFPEPAGKWQISTDGAGSDAFWGPEGNEIFYAQGIKAVRVALTTAGTFSASRPQVLFEIGDYVGGTLAPDGKRFLMIKDDVQTAAPNRIDVSSLARRAQDEGGGSGTLTEAVSGVWVE